MISLYQRQTETGIDIMSREFFFRFDDPDKKKKFHIEAIKLNKSMNELLNSLVDHFLSKEKLG